jgi:hypothetical protein
MDPADKHPERSQPDLQRILPHGCNRVGTRAIRVALGAVRDFDQNSGVTKQQLRAVQW